MKKISLLLATLLVMLLSYHQTAAQQRGDIAVGVRATPDGGGATAKFYFDPNFAIEAQLNGAGLYDGSSVTAVGLAEYHVYLPDPSWRIFFGGGIHFGSWDRYYWDDPQPIFGIDAIGGVEYMFKKVPVGLTADFKPAINFASDVAFFPHNIVGVAGRFYFGTAMHHKAPPPRYRR